MAEILITLAAMALCLLGEGFFSGSEIGIVSADRLKLRHQASQGSRGASLALKMLDKPEWLLATTLVGTNIFVVTNTTLATALMIQLFGDKGVWLAVAFVAPLIWVFGEIVPKSVFQQKADAVTPKAIFPLRFCTLLFSPVLIVFTLLARLLSRLAGTGSSEGNPFTLREEIITMVQMSGEESDIEPIEQDMIRRMFQFSETTVRDIMVPLIDVVGVERGMTVGEVRRVARANAHQRMPVYQERVDRVIGMVDALELLGIASDQAIESYIQPVGYVPEAKSIQILLMDLRKAQQLMAVVVDEFGGASGIVAVEDILEEVVRDVRDEHDAAEAPSPILRKLGDREYLCNARIDLEALNELLGDELPEGAYATLGGFLLEKFGDIPAPGTVIKYQNITFRVQKSTAQAVQEVRVKW